VLEVVAAPTRPGQTCDWYAGCCGKIARFLVIFEGADKWAHACGNHVGRLVREAAGHNGTNDDVIVQVIP
jgi:hypothetical protein